MNHQGEFNGHPVAVPDTRRVTPEPTSISLIGEIYGHGVRTSSTTVQACASASNTRVDLVFPRVTPQPWYRRLWQRIRGQR